MLLSLHCGGDKENIIGLMSPIMFFSFVIPCSIGDGQKIQKGGNV